MTKKRSRSARRSAARRTSTGAAVRTAEAAATPRAQAAMPANVDFSSEYHYVLRDLRRLGQLAAAMFVALIALALIVR